MPLFEKLVKAFKSAEKAVTNFTTKTANSIMEGVTAGYWKGKDNYTGWGENPAPTENNINEDAKEKVEENGANEPEIPKSGTGKPEIPKNGTSADGTSENGTSANGTSENGTSANGTSENGTSANGTSANGTSENGTSANGTSANGTVEDKTDENIEIPMYYGENDVFNWIEAQQRAQWEREDAIRKEVQAREDTAIQRQVEDAIRAGVNPNLIDITGAESGGGITNATGKDYTVYEKEMEQYLKELEMLFDKNFQGNEKDKDRTIEVITSIMTMFGLMARGGKK